MPFGRDIRPSQPTPSVQPGAQPRLAQPRAQPARAPGRGMPQMPMGGPGQMDPALIELLMEAMRSQQPAGEPGRIPPGAVQNQMMNTMGGGPPRPGMGSKLPPSNLPSMLSRQQPGGQPARVGPSAMASPPGRPGLDPAALMRMMQGTMDPSAMASPPSRSPVDPAALMQMMMGTAGQGVDPRGQQPGNAMGSLADRGPAAERGLMEMMRGTMGGNPLNQVRQRRVDTIEEERRGREAQAARYAPGTAATYNRDPRYGNTPGDITAQMLAMHQGNFGRGR